MFKLILILYLIISMFTGFVYWTEIDIGHNDNNLSYIHWDKCKWPGKIIIFFITWVGLFAMVMVFLTEIAWDIISSKFKKINQ